MAISKSISELSVAPSISAEDLVLISRNDHNNLVSLQATLGQIEDRIVETAKSQVSSEYIETVAISVDTLNAKLENYKTDSDSKVNALNASTILSAEQMSSWIKEEYIDKTNAKVAKIENDISVIPAQAYAEGNELADKTWVNSTIATSTGYFRGTYQKIEDLPDISDPYVVDPPYSNNDYAFVLSTDEEETPVYAKFKIVETEGHLEWKFEYFLNNSSFTAVQWAAINSGVTESFVNKLKDFNPENAISAVYVDGTTIVKGPGQYGILSVGTLSSDQIEMGLGDNNFGGQGAFGKISLHYQESDADTNSVKVVQDSIDPVSETSLREAAYFKANSIDYKRIDTTRTLDFAAGKENSIVISSELCSSIDNLSSQLDQKKLDKSSLSCVEWRFYLKDDPDPEHYVPFNVVLSVQTDEES